MLEKLFRIKNTGDCYFEQNNVSFETIQKFQSNGFLLSAYFYALILITTLIGMERNLYWISDDFYELTLAYLYRKNLETDKKLLLDDM